MRWLEQERVLVRRINYLVSAITLCKKNDNINRPYYVKVKHIIKEWHIAIYHQDISKFIFDAFCKRENEQRYT